MMTEDLFTRDQLHLLSRALQVDSRLVESELLGFTLVKKSEGSTHNLARNDILDAWNTIPKTLAIHPNPQSATASQTSPCVIYSGASPRSSSCLLNGTYGHPHLTRLVTSFIRSNCPQFCFTTFSIREELSREPHRDARNGPCGTYFQVLSQVRGGGLWIAHKRGEVQRVHNGSLVWGFDLEAKNDPVIFDARRCLHASQPWDSSDVVKRVVLIAWTVIHIRTMPESMRQELQELGFPVPTLADLSADVPDSWVPVASPANKRTRLTQPCLSFSRYDAPGLPLQGNEVLHHLD